MVKKTLDGELRRGGPLVRMVSRESATLTSVDVSNHVPIDGNHSTIVKFTGSADPGYKSFVQRLENCVKTASEVVKARLNRMSQTTSPFPALSHIAGRPRNYAQGNQYIQGGTDYGNQGQVDYHM